MAFAFCSIAVSPAAVLSRTARKPSTALFSTALAADSAQDLAIKASSDAFLAADSKTDFAKAAASEAPCAALPTRPSILDSAHLGPCSSRKCSASPPKCAAMFMTCSMASSMLSKVATIFAAPASMHREKKKLLVPSKLMHRLCTHLTLGSILRNSATVLTCSVTWMLMRWSEPILPPNSFGLATLYIFGCASKNCMLVCPILVVCLFTFKSCFFVPCTSTFSSSEVLNVSVMHTWVCSTCDTNACALRKPWR
mmetsp:Transcript_80416/g.213446  ORF Transcript_80416/g.213446 Transcript_80416/m.213446 type:complete len:253 (-) Transcript_80416:340-1098(-)